jgi:hypothetical protein
MINITINETVARKVLSVVDAGLSHGFWGDLSRVKCASRRLFALHSACRVGKLEFR